MCHIEKAPSSYENNHLETFTNTCWSLYSERLKNISNKYFELGKIRYKKANPEILDSVKDWHPMQSALSVTYDGSIHYTFRLAKSLDLFIETFLHEDGNHNTYFELFKYDKLVYSGRESLRDGLSVVSRKIQELNERDQEGCVDVFAK